MTMKRSRVVALLGAVVLLVVAAAWLRAGSTGPSQAPVDRDRAAALALDFYGRQRPPADSLSDVRVVGETQVTGSSGRPAWEVQIDGGVTEPGSPTTYLSMMVLDVDIGTGVVTLVMAG